MGAGCFCIFVGGAGPPVCGGLGGGGRLLPDFLVDGWFGGSGGGSLEGITDWSDDIIKRVN